MINLLETVNLESIGSSFFAYKIINDIFLRSREPCVSIFGTFVPCFSFYLTGQRVYWSSNSCTCYCLQLSTK